MPLIAEPRAVDRIDVVSIRAAGIREQRATLPGDVIGTWRGGRFRVALDLVAALPPSEQMRCFLPRYGIRVHAGSSVLAEVAFCFRCHNARALPSEHTPHRPSWFTFDPDSPPAQELLHLFRTTDRPADRWTAKGPG